MAINGAALSAAILEQLPSIAAVAAAVLVIYSGLHAFRTVRSVLAGGDVGGSSKSIGGGEYVGGSDATADTFFQAVEKAQGFNNSRSTAYLQQLAARLEAENAAEERAFFGDEPDWNGPNVTSGKADPADHEFAAFKLQQAASEAHAAGQELTPHQRWLIQADLAEVTAEVRDNAAEDAAYSANGTSYFDMINRKEIGKAQSFG